MQFPKYESHDAPLTDVTESYFDFMVEDSKSREVMPYSNERMSTFTSASRMILHGLKDGDYPGLFDEVHQAAQQELMGDTVIHPFDSMREVGLTAALLQSAGDSEQILAIRRSMHDMAINHLHSALSLYEASSKLKGQDIFLTPDSELLGRLTHYTALSLLTRLNHPRLIAVSALQYQDMSPIRAHNFDILVIESPLASGSSGNSPALAHKLQLKSACLGWCEETSTQSEVYRYVEANRGLRPPLSAPHTKLEKHQERYSPDICLISGCCDLEGNSSRTEGDRDKSATARLLLREYDRDLSPQEINTLDTVSNHLLLVSTGDPTRKGTKQVDDKGCEPLTTAMADLLAVWQAKTA